MTVRAGTAVVCTAAGQAVVGARQLIEWEHALTHVGLRAIRVDRCLPQARGVGGDGKVKEVVLLPVGIRGHIGIMEFVVLEQDLPPLLPIGFLGMLGATIHLGSLTGEKVYFSKLGTSSPLDRLRSGHRTIQVDEFPSGRFATPPSAIGDWPDLTRDSFSVQGNPRTVRGRSSSRAGSNARELHVQARQERGEEGRRGGGREMDASGVASSSAHRAHQTRSDVGHPATEHRGQVQNDSSSGELPSPEERSPKRRQQVRVVHALHEVRLPLEVHQRRVASDREGDEGQGLQEGRAPQPQREQRFVLPVDGNEAGQAGSDATDHRSRTGAAAVTDPDGAATAGRRAQPSLDADDEPPAGAFRRLDAEHEPLHDEHPGEFLCGECRGTSDPGGSIGTTTTSSTTRCAKPCRDGGPHHGRLGPGVGTERRPVLPLLALGGLNFTGNAKDAIIAECQNTSGPLIAMSTATLPFARRGIPRVFKPVKTTVRRFARSPDGWEVTDKIDDQHGGTLAVDLCNLLALPAEADDDHECCVPGRVREACHVMLTSTSRRSARKQSRAVGSSHGCDIAELFSPPRVCVRAEQLGLRPMRPGSLDLRTGWDLMDKVQRAAALALIHEQRPYFGLLEPECTMCSRIQNLFDKEARSDPAEWNRRWIDAVDMVAFCMEVAHVQHVCGRKFLFEHPWTAISWELNSVNFVKSLPGVHLVRIDMCAVGMPRESDGGIVRKSTGMMTNDEAMASELEKLTCDGSHEHIPLLGGKNSHAARVYPPKLCDIIARAVRKSLEGKHINDGLCMFHALSKDSHSFVDESSDDSASEADEVEQVESDSDPDHPRALKPLSSADRSQINRAHVNLGHPGTDTFIRVLRAARACPEVLKYVRDEYECPDCASHPRLRAHRRAALPRTYQFNRVVGCGVFKVTLYGIIYNFLNLICHGANFQVVALIGSGMELSAMATVDYVQEDVASILRTPGDSHHRWGF